MDSLLVEKKYKPSLDSEGEVIPKKNGNLKPDFVFLSDIGEEQEIIVFELKGPESEKTIQPSEYKQLREYLDIIRSAYSNKKVKVAGVLVGHETGGVEETDKRIEVVTWASVLAAARAMHVSYLASLLSVSEPLSDDARLKQISDFGGKETMELLSRLLPIANFPSILKNEIEKRR